MKKIKRFAEGSAPSVSVFSSVVAGAALLAAAECAAANPFITSIYTADPSAHVWKDGRLYVYASHDMDPARGCDLMDRYHVFSTADMVDWTDHGEILRSDDVSWGRPEGGFMWAPDCAYRDGTYYFYFPHPSESKWNTTWKIGVATSKNPASGFTDQGYIKGLGGEFMIDPCVFIDTDGQAYMYYGGGRICQGGKLKASMMELDGAMQDMVGLEDFHEATWVFKRNDLYYLTYADNHVEKEGDRNVGLNQLCYAVSKSPLGPWEYKGVYLKPTGCDTSHGSVVEFKGEWYAFYHNKSISNTGKGNLRSVCVDRLNFNDDGTIQTVRQTRTGVPPVPVCPGAVTLQAESAILIGAALVADDSGASGGKCVKNIHAAGAAIQFEKVDGGQGGMASVEIYYASTERGKLRLTVNGEDFSFVNTFPTENESVFNGRTGLTVPLKAGCSNTIRLDGGNGGVNADCVVVTRFD